MKAAFFFVLGLCVAGSSAFGEVVDESTTGPVGGGGGPAEPEWCYVDATISCVEAAANTILEVASPYAVLACKCESFDGGLNFSCADTNKVLVLAEEGKTLAFARKHQVITGQGTMAGKKSVTEGTIVDCGKKEQCASGNCVTVTSPQGGGFRSCKTVSVPGGDALPIKERRASGDDCVGITRPMIAIDVAVAVVGD